ITINVTPTASVSGATLSNVASVTGGGDPSCVDADDCESTPVETDVGAPEITITKTGPSTAVVGVAFDYTLTDDNIGSADATAAATVMDTVPTGLTINSAGPNCSIAGQVVTCTIAAEDLQVADPAVAITINVTPLASVDGTS